MTIEETLLTGFDRRERAQYQNGGTLIIKGWEAMACKAFRHNVPKPLRKWIRSVLLYSKYLRQCEWICYLEAQ